MERNLKFLGLGAAVRWFGTSMVYPYVGVYLRNVLGVGYAEIGVVLFLIAAAPLAVAPFGGLLADRAGRRRVLLLSLAAETAGVIAIAFSMRSGLIFGVILGGMATGVAGNIEYPASSAYVADYAKGSDRTRANSWIRIGFNVGFTAGVASGGLLIGVLGFPGTGFFSGAVIGSATLVLALLLSPSPYDVAKSRPGAQVVSTAKVVPIRESIRTLVNDRNFAAMSLAFAFASMAYSQWNTTFPIFVNTVVGVPLWILGPALALNGAIVIFGQAPITRTMIGKKHTESAVISTVLLVAALVALGFFSLFQGTILIAIFSFIVLLTVGENFGAIPFTTLPSNMAPATEIGSYNGAFSFIAGLGAALAPTLGGVALSATGDPLVIWCLLAVPAVPAVLLFRWVGRRIPAEANRV